MDALWQVIEQTITEKTHRPFYIKSTRPVGGGSINCAYIIEGDRTYFVKVNSLEYRDMFEAEAEGLAALATAQVIRVPSVIAVNRDQNSVYLVLEYIPMIAAKAVSDAKLGEQLAALHQCYADQFGWHRDNTIGTTRQPNRQTDDWVAFWQQRLQFQLNLADDQGYRGQLSSLGERLLTHLPVFFETYTPKASLLHGDLWSGNFGYDEQGEPVIFDPAVYYGDRETDLAMTELFGGFSNDFYAAYQTHYPLDAGYSVRKILYNLYHILNHLNLFGCGYQSQAEAMLTRLCSE